MQIDNVITGMIGSKRLLTANTAGESVVDNAVTSRECSASARGLI
jgi:hypothetical protein